MFLSKTIEIYGFSIAGTSPNCPDAVIEIQNNIFQQFQLGGAPSAGAAQAASWIATSVLAWMEAASAGPEDSIDFLKDYIKFPSGFH